MNAKTILAILFLVSIAVAAAVFVRALPSQSGAATGASANISVPTREILVAAALLSAGTLLRGQDVRWWAPPADTPTIGEILRPTAEKREAKPEIDEEARGEVRGAALRTYVTAGAPILRGDLVKPDDRDFLHVVLRAGTRAVPIPNQLAAGGGMLSPGDHVDLILTQNFKTDAPAARRTVGETIAYDLRVLKVEGTNVKTDAASAPRTVIVEVSREQAERINVASELGKLSLILRGGDAMAQGGAPSEGAVRATIKPVWAGDVSPALAGTATPPPPPPPENPPVQMFHGMTKEMVKP
jgi:pilus assembly protein CpaB